MTIAIDPDLARRILAAPEIDPMLLPRDCVVFDTETTGFDPEQGDRLVEIGAVRMRDGLPTREHFHAYINPDRLMPQAAVEVHGLTTEFLADKPYFHEVAIAFLDFVGDLPLVAHNASFDRKFITHELAQLGLPAFPAGRYIDTLPIAKKRFPGAMANLDALCKRFRISLSNRSKHGALVDSELLAEVCVELSGGRQTDLFGAMTATAAQEETTAASASAAPRRVVRATPSPAEAEAHRALVDQLGEGAIWNRYPDIIGA